MFLFRCFSSLYKEAGSGKRWEGTGKGKVKKRETERKEKKVFFCIFFSDVFFLVSVGFCGFGGDSSELKHAASTQPQAFCLIGRACDSFDDVCVCFWGSEGR